MEGIYYIRVVEYSSDKRETCNQCLLKVVFSFKFKLTNDHTQIYDWLWIFEHTCIYNSFKRYCYLIRVHFQHFFMKLTYNIMYNMLFFNSQNYEGWGSFKQCDEDHGPLQLGHDFLPCFFVFLHQSCDIWR